MYTQIKRISLLLVVSVFTAVAAFGLQPASVTHAMPPEDDTNPPLVAPLPDDNEGALKQAALGRVFQREQKNHERQEKAIEKAARGADRTSELIAKAKENKKNTAALEKALATFNTKLGEIRLKFDQTGKLIKQHDGFDDKGKVTDETKAKATVDAVHKGNQEVRQGLAEALEILREAGKAYREANPKPTATPTAKTS